MKFSKSINSTTKCWRIYSRRPSRQHHFASYDKWHGHPSTKGPRLQKSSIIHARKRKWSSRNHGLINWSRRCTTWVSRLPVFKRSTWHKNQQNFSCHTQTLLGSLICSCSRTTYLLLRRKLLKIYVLSSTLFRCCKLSIKLDPRLVWCWRQYFYNDGTTAALDAMEGH